jgi:hypothetical protein
MHEAENLHGMNNGAGAIMAMKYLLPPLKK